mmetsp:Transcript_34699/g.86052  ORF Transcript_34699/g.86052 Transcript_34699/m.86052 type:complete len:450 (+) Transcript_34699:139-1488(+)
MEMEQSAYDRQVPFAPYGQLPASQTNGVIPAPSVTFRSPDQLSQLRGRKCFRPCTPIATVLAIVFIYAITREIGVLLFCLSVIPVIAILFLLYHKRAHEMSVELLLEMFWTGALLSCLAAVILEGTGTGYETTSQALKDCHISLVPEAQTPKNGTLTPTAAPPDSDSGGGGGHPPSLYCDLKFFVYILIVVGASEELCKFVIAMSRVRLRVDALPYTCACWWRVVDTPYALALVGATAAAGFACIENIEYNVFSTLSAFNPTGPNLLGALLQTLLRAVLAIPFHVSATGYASCRLAKFLFAQPTNALSSTAPLRPSNTEMNGLVSGGAGGGGAGGRRDRQHHVHYETLAGKGPSLLDYASFLWLPILMHGTYDSCLMLMTLYAMNSANGVALTLLLTAMGAFLVMVVMFIWEWWSLRKLPFYEQRGGAEGGMMIEVTSGPVVTEVVTRE